MWQVANFLKKNGIASFNGKQVEAGQDWMQKWLGKMPDADVCLAMISADYFASGPCKEEIYETTRKGIPILPIIFETPPPQRRRRRKEKKENKSNNNSLFARDLASVRPSVCVCVCVCVCVLLVSEGGVRCLSPFFLEL